MSILGDIEKRCNEKPPKLILYEPFDPVPRIRKIYVAADLHKFIMGPWQNEHDQNLSTEIQTDFDRFVSGEEITVALQAKARTRVPNANLKRLYKEIEVWEFRIRGSKPQQRVFGRFAEWNRFVALFRDDRRDVDWDDASLRVGEDWTRLFSWNPFKVGRKADDYVSKPVVSL